MGKRNLISLLEDSFSSLKDSLERNDEPLHFTQEYVIALKKETMALLALCDMLNADAAFIQKINASADTSKTGGLLLRAEHFVVSDLIQAYIANIDSETPKSRFTLAYFYDVLRNKQFADEKAIQTLNRLASSESFRLHLQKIIGDNIVVPKNAQQKYLLVSALTQAKNAKAKEISAKMGQFVQFAFEGKAKPETQMTAASPTDATLKNSLVSECPADDTLEKALSELHELIGLSAVKKDVAELVNLLEIQTKRTDQGLKNIDLTLHTVFLGPPGTGKTSVARLLSRIFKHLGFVSKGQLYETDREGLIAGYVGQTAAKVDKAVTESLGGVLFVDEAYALTQNAFGNDYGAEAVNTLIKRMEDHRDDLAVVVAGYTEPMHMFIESNPGLRSRFNRFFHFDHFTPAELLLVFETFCKKSDFVLSAEAKEKLSDTFDLLYEKKDEGFGNARVVRNLFEKCVQNQANRIVGHKKLTPKILKTFTEADIPEPMQTVGQVFPASKD
jgi:stage V sporulation protein K